MSETTTSPEGSAPPIVEVAPVAAQPALEATMQLRWTKGASTLQQAWKHPDGTLAWADVPVDEGA